MGFFFFFFFLGGEQYHRFCSRLREIRELFTKSGFCPDKREQKEA
jgi:hypothetical protein